MPLTRQEIASILAACDDYPDKLNAIRLRALVLLLRYSGLRIGDAVTLSRDRIVDGKLFLYTAKTGTAVYCPLPPFVIALSRQYRWRETIFSGPANRKSRALSAIGNDL